MSEPQLLGMPTIRADFNGASQAGILVASSRFLESTLEGLRSGIAIVVRDWEGNSCLGTITETAGLSVGIQLAWHTWQSEASAVQLVENLAFDGGWYEPSPDVTRTHAEVAA